VFFLISCAGGNLPNNFTPKRCHNFIFINKSKEKIKSVAILFSGGGGNINLDTKKGPQKKNNFLVRSRKHFANGGILAITADVSTDLGELWDKRDSLGHQQDIAALIEFI